MNARPFHSLRLRMRRVRREPPGVVDAAASAGAAGDVVVIESPISRHVDVNIAWGNRSMLT
ncbi:hypothetical protein GCM10009819_28990 [Agromyces tropicus]|uniref:Uncharacterized protein n=1 Tax=Agromyces tropicus TaxID=555371 RepID=A0ABP5GBE1_9MICO